MPTLRQRVEFGRQRDADVWVWRDEWKTNHAKSPTSYSPPETQSLEQRPSHQAEMAASAKTGLVDPRAARAVWEHARRRSFQRRNRQQTAWL